jgi:hypothetical protein
MSASVHLSQRAARGRSRFVERVYLGRDAVRRPALKRNPAALGAAATSSERRK